MDLVLVVGQRTGRGYHRDIDRGREVARRDLVAERAHGLGRGLDEDDAVPSAGFREFRALRQEAIAGMDGVSAARPGDADDLLDGKVGLERPEMQLPGAAASDETGLIGLEAVKR